MITATNVPAGFSTIFLSGSDIQNTWAIWGAVLPGLQKGMQVPAASWCDCGVDVNPSNGRFAQQIRAVVPGETIWEMNGVYFSYNETVAAFYNPPSVTRK